VSTFVLLAFLVALSDSSRIRVSLIEDKVDAYDCQVLVEGGACIQTISRKATRVSTRFHLESRCDSRGV
jgi:hypothetical protein